jgi:hypothetical protein
MTVTTFTPRGGSGWLLDIDPRDRKVVRMTIHGDSVSMDARLHADEARRLSAALLKAAEAAR